MNSLIAKRLLRVARVIQALRNRDREKYNRTTKTLFHVGKRPASPKPNSRYSGHRFPAEGTKAVFLTSDWIPIVSYGIKGNVYKYKIPMAAIREAGGLKRYDEATEIIFNEKIWDKYDLGKTLVGKIDAQKAKEKADVHKRHNELKSRAVFENEQRALKKKREEERRLPPQELRERRLKEAEEAKRMLESKKLEYF